MHNRFGAWACKTCVLEGNVEKPQKDWLWDSASRPVLASFVKRLYNQQGPPRSHYFIKVGQESLSLRPQRKRSIIDLCICLTDARLCLGAWPAGLDQLYHFISLFAVLTHVLCVVIDPGLPALETTHNFCNWLIMKRKPAGLVSAWFYIFKICWWNPLRTGIDSALAHDESCFSLLQDVVCYINMNPSILTCASCL